MRTGNSPNMPGVVQSQHPSACGIIMREPELDGGFPARGGRDGDEVAGAGGDGGADGGAGDAGAREVEVDAGETCQYGRVGEGGCECRRVKKGLMVMTDVGERALSMEEKGGNGAIRSVQEFATMRFSFGVEIVDDPVAQGAGGEGKGESEGLVHDADVIRVSELVQRFPTRE